MLQHGFTYVIWIFSVQCSFSMGYLTTTLHNQIIINTPTKNPNNWVNSVIFEPQPKIQLTHSSYKVTSFLDFQPFLQGFQSINNYLHNLWADVNNPSYFWYLFLSFAHVPIDPTLNDTHIKDFLNSPACQKCPYVCQAKMKFE